MSASLAEVLTEPRIECTVRVGKPCNRTAAELLLIRNPGAPWYVAPRCTEHPASRDVSAMAKADPSAETVIVTLPGAMSGDHRCGTCGYTTAKCAENRSHA